MKTGPLWLVPWKRLWRTSTPPLNMCKPVRVWWVPETVSTNWNVAVARCWRLKKLPSVVSGNSCIGDVPRGDTVVSYSCTSAVVSENSSSLQSERSVNDPVATRPRVLTLASGGVNVPSVACLAFAGNHPPAAITRCFGVTFASSRVNELNRFDVRNSDCGRLSTSLLRYWYCAACCRKTRSLISGPPVSNRGENDEMPTTSKGLPRVVRNDGSSLLMRVFQVSVARRVLISTSPDENRPYSTAYGFGRTVTESIASSGNATCEAPVAGSTKAPAPSCVAA